MVSDNSDSKRCINYWMLFAIAVSVSSSAKFWTLAALIMQKKVIKEAIK